MEIPASYSSPFDDGLGTTVVEASGDRVVVELRVKPTLHQPNGIVHGGVYATMVETAASIGANVWLGDASVPVVGLSNHTDFLRAVRDGTLRAVAVPVHRGRTLQLWHVEVTDEQERPVASGKVRLMALRDR